MPLPVPNLDDKRWSEIVETGRSRIPRVSQEWTDFNVHDPGITFIELFSWLAEIQRFRLSRVSAETKHRFLELVDLELKPLTPARVLIEFGTPPETPVFVEGGARVLPIGKETIVFQAGRETYLTANRLKRVVTELAGRRVDQTEANAAPEIAFYPFTEEAPPGAILELEFERHFDVPELQMAIELFEDDLPDPGAHADETADVEPSVDLVWEFLDDARQASSGGATWAPLEVLEDGTTSLYRSGLIRFQTVSSGSPGSFFIRCRLVGGRYEIPPAVRAIRINVLEAWQIEMVPPRGRARSLGALDEPVPVLSESLGLGDGRPDQVFHLAKAPVLPVRPASERPRDSAPWPPGAGLVLEVGEVGIDQTVEWSSWKRVEDFCRSGPRDRHYALDEASGEIRFGNGLNGRVPGLGEPVRVRGYRHSDGARGNLPAGQTWEVGTGTVRLTGTNPGPASGGLDPEPIDEALGRALRRFHERLRAVNRGDLERLALRTPGLRVARAAALPRHDPAFPCVEVPDSVTVVIVPFRRDGDPRPPEPGSGFRDTVRSHLERHRLLTTALHVVGPEFVPVTVSARVFLARRASEEEVRPRLQRALEEFFDPLDGGPESTGWPLGRAIYPSEIYERLDRDPGVDHAIRVRLNARAIDEPLALPPSGLPQFSWEESEIELIAFEDRQASRNGKVGACAPAGRSG